MTIVQDIIIGLKKISPITYGDNMHKFLLKMIF
jgi:hypothetical protein